MDETAELKAIVLDIPKFADLCLKRTVRTPGGRVGDDRSTGSRSNGTNWVERTKKGSLPKYIRIVRNGLMREGHSESRATALAVAAIKRWARGGDNVSPKVQAAAKAALAEWEAMKAEKSDDSNVEEKAGNMKIEHKTVGVSGVKVLGDPEDGIVEAFVSVTGLKDNVNDIIEPGAYEETLKTRMPKGIWSHDWNKPVSKTLAIKELLPGSPELPKFLADGETPWPADAGALKVKTQFNLDTQDGRDAYANVKFYGDQQEWSIGYNVPAGAATMSTKGGTKTRNIKRLDLFEFSPVLWGAMPQARSTSVKAAQETHMLFKSLIGNDYTVTHSLEELEEFIAEHKEYFGEDEPVIETKNIGTLDETDLFTEIAEKGILSADNINLLQKAHGVLTELLEVALGTGEKKETPKFDLGNFDVTEVKSLMDVFDSVDSAKVLPDDLMESLEALVDDFDAAQLSGDEKSLEDAATKVIDFIDEEVDGVSDGGADGMKAIALSVASLLTKQAASEGVGAEGGNNPADGTAVKERGSEVEEKSMVTRSLDELDIEGTKAWLDSI